jgi:monofunctional glycosyltransferase
MSSKTDTEAKKPRKRAPAKKAVPAPPQPSALRMWLRLFARLTMGAAGALLTLIVLFTVINPPTTPYQLAEGWRLSGVKQEWRALEDISPYMARSVIAAEDANFCLHWGFDMSAIRAALAEGEGRGASTISQQTVKNVFLWQGRSWVRKALEAGITPVAELIWTKRRMVEIYLNVAEFGSGVFGAEAAAQHYYGISAAELTATQAARLAALLPSPKRWSPDDAHVRKRAAQIIDGAATIEVDGRAACLGEL